MRFLAVLLAALASGLIWTPAIAQKKDFAQVPATGPLAQGKLYGKSFALLIGVNQYVNAPGNNLRYAVNDVTALRDVLIRSYGFPAENVTTLTDGQATGGKIREALNALTDNKRVGKDDRILIYFSGHGQTVKRGDGGEAGFLIPNDAQIDLTDSANIAPYRRSCLSVSEIWDTLDDCPARHALLLADCCFSGLLAQSRAYAKPSQETLIALAHKRTRQIMTAGEAGEESQESSAWGHGAFTYQLLEELQAHAALEDTVFTARELHASLQFDVSNLTKAKQSPQFRDKDTSGEFLFFTTKPHSVPPLVIAGATDSSKESGFIPLFTGKKEQFEQWKQYEYPNSSEPGGFRMEGHTLVTTGGRGGLFYTKQKFKDFVLRLEWKAEDALANSGIFAHTKTDFSYQREVQIYDGADFPAIQRTGAIFKRAAPTKFPAQIGQWNRMEIKVLGAHFVVKINDETVTEYDDPDVQEGYLALQNWHDANQAPPPVYFRNVRIKLLTSAGDASSVAPAKKGYRFDVATPFRAEQDYRDALAKSPKDFTLTMEAAKFMMLVSKDNAQATRLYHNAATLRPDSPEPYNWLGYMQLYRVGAPNIVEAEKWFRKALDIDPNCAFAWREIADINGYFTKRDWAEAERIELKLIALDPKFSEAYEGLGWACKRRNDFKQAEIYFRKGWEAKRGNLYNAIGLADIWRQQGKTLEAEEILREALNTEPDNVNPDWNERSLTDVYVELGRLCLNQKKDYKEAERLLTRAAERNPYDASVKADLKRAIEAQKN